MGEFTKEELMNISDAILYSELIESRGEVLSPIIDKIQSMIDKYCEHAECHTIINYENEVIGICKKCGIKVY